MNEAVSKIKSEFNIACQDSNKIPGSILAAIDRNGKLLLHESAGIRQVGSNEPMSKDGLCWMASCTKLITAIACLQLVEQGKLQLDEPISKVLPEISELEKNYKTKTTLRHLLNHTAGQSYPFFNPNTCEWFKKNNLESFGCKKQSLYAPLDAEPGSKWQYGSSIDWASQAVEKASGLSLDDYFKQNIFEPLGIKNMTVASETGVPGGVKKTLAGMNFKEDGKTRPMDHAIELDQSKVEVQLGGAGAFGNAAEYCQILSALLNKGTHPITKKAILKPESVEELTRDQFKDESLLNDMTGQIPAAQPEYTNSFKILEGTPKNWTFAGCKVPGFIWWAGIANHYWFMDIDNGVAAMIQCQIFPFFDADVLGLFFGHVLPELQKAAQAA